MDEKGGRGGGGVYLLRTTASFRFKISEVVQEVTKTDAFVRPYLECIILDRRKPAESELTIEDRHKLHKN